MRPRLENDLPSCDRPLDRSVDNHLIGRNRSLDESAARDDERLAVQFALNLSIEFDQALGGDASLNLQSFSDDRFASGPEHERLHAFELPLPTGKETRSVEIRNGFTSVAPRRA